MKTFLFVLEAVLGLVVVVSILMQKSKADALSGLVQGSKSETFFTKNKSKTKEAMLVKVNYSFNAFICYKYSSFKFNLRLLGSVSISNYDILLFTNVKSKL